MRKIAGIFLNEKFLISYALILGADSLVCFSGFVQFNALVTLGCSCEDSAERFVKPVVLPLPEFIGKYG